MRKNDSSQMSRQNNKAQGEQIEKSLKNKGKWLVLRNCAFATFEADICRCIG